ncbi:FecR family protein [Larkinella soli]|uniref:FecR family protein n=1 Tax=Larkinella soli TaxID=1770527 RepID=UPI000FFB397C|nr:FecR domain-containing protein [Larkinella soli]
MDAQLLQKYLKNECSPDEALVVLAYLSGTDGQQHLKQLLDVDLQSLEALPLDEAENRTARQLFNRMQIRKQATAGVVRPLRRPERRFTWLAAAAVTLLLLATGGWWAYRQLTPPETVTLRTDYGQTRRVVLPDRSVVTLNGNTSITYPEEWSPETPREVWVEGEAFFEVVHTLNHQRFTVHLPSNMNVEVLGTRFNVYTRKSRTRVVLNDGRIQMKVSDDPNNHLVMKPGEMFFADTQAKVFYKKAVNAQAQSSWRTEKLVFDGTTLQEIAQLLEDTYGLEVVIADRELLRQKFSGTIPGKNVETILNGLSRLFDMKITRQPDRIIIQQN